MRLKYNPLDIALGLGHIAMQIANGILSIDRKTSVGDAVVNTALITVFVSTQAAEYTVKNAQRLALAGLYLGAARLTGVALKIEEACR